ncbi:unnamed protein product, partial [Adineta steineri]
MGPLGPQDTVEGAPICGGPTEARELSEQDKGR